MNMRRILLASATMGCTTTFWPAQAAVSAISSAELVEVGDAVGGKTTAEIYSDATTTSAPSGHLVAPVLVTADRGAEQTASQVGEGEIIVTAQKRAQSVNNVGLSITAVSGDVLASRGITDPSQLTKLVSGFNYNETASANPVYTIRGVGYQDSSIASSPAVTVYVDEVPIPYSSATLGAALDIERVEVLKGPQGTLYGGNSTGGAINYIAAKPTDKFAAGVNWDFGRFAMSNLTGYLGGPITDTLSIRISGRWLKSDSWQQSYTRNDQLGAKDQLYGRIIADWHPIDKLKVEISVNGWRDHSESQAAQLIGKQGALPGVPLDPGFTSYPLAPNNARAADWDPGTNYHHGDSFYQATGRLDYQASDALKLTSISSYEVYKRRSPNDLDGTSRPISFQTSTGEIKTFFQELRASATVAGTGNVTVGANYQSDKINELDLLSIPAETSSLIVGKTFDFQNSQNVKSQGVFTSGDMPILSQLSVVGGVRYSTVDRSYVGCTRDSGDGSAATTFGGLVGVNIPPGGCLTLQPNGQPGLFTSRLSEDSVSWRAGLNYKPNRNILLYANVSRGFKAGAYQSLASATFTTLVPVVQEQLTAYEVGFKAGLFDRLLQLDGAAFYYNYVNKQIRSIVNDPIFGSIEALVNIPKSRVAGFELSALLRPLRGLSISSSVTLTDSKVTGPFLGESPASVVLDVRGEAFPYTPKWSGNADAEYRWGLNDHLEAVLGATGTFQTATNGGFGMDPTYRIRGYALLDLRASIESDGGRWRAGLFGRNVTNQYYWFAATRNSDAATRFAGMPATYGINLGFRY